MNLSDKLDFMDYAHKQGRVGALQYLKKMRLKRIASVQITICMSVKRNTLGCQNHRETLFKYIKIWLKIIEIPP